MKWIKITLLTPNANNAQESNHLVLLHQVIYPYVDKNDKWYFLTEKINLIIFLSTRKNPALSQIFFRIRQLSFQK